MEGVRNGVPFLCWPYFADQFMDRSYITDVWRTGLAVSPNTDGIVTKEELRSKVEQVLGDGEGLGEQLGGVEHLPADLLRRGREPPDCLRDELLVGHDGRIRGRRDVEVARRRRRERGAGGHGGLQPRHRRLQPLH